VTSLKHVFQGSAGKRRFFFLDPGRAANFERSEKRDTLRTAFWLRFLARQASAVTRVRL
jgi:hypothetical protein